jgi:hypothetical protein
LPSLLFLFLFLNSSLFLSILPLLHALSSLGSTHPTSLPPSLLSVQDAGINHKEFGVTSEGVVVYLDVALRSVLKINPNK